MFVKFNAIFPAATLLLASCAVEGGDAYANPHEPTVGSSAVPQDRQHCDASGSCHLQLRTVDAAKAVCDGASASLYWNKGERTSLLACECDCTSHDNFGWLVYGPSGHVQGIGLGKAATATAIRDAHTVEDIMSSHGFCDAFDRSELDVRGFVSLIKYPTGNSESPYCFSVRTIREIHGSIEVQDDGQSVDPDDENAFFDTPTGVQAEVRRLVRSARNQE